MLTKRYPTGQSGQTLIETLVAAFVLVMGITAALGLAIYSLGATSSIRQETIALGLAREGIEVVKNIRDTNWMKDTISTTCHDFLTGTNVSYCYPNWTNPASNGQDISASTGQRRFALRYDSTKSNPWRLIPTETDFGLNLLNFTKAATDGFDGPYYIAVDGLTATEGDSGFARAITITQDSSFKPFDQNTGPRLKVTVDVWWLGKNCTMTSNPPAGNSCKVTLETYLTNWRNF